MALTEKVRIERQAKSTATALMSDKLVPALIAAGMIMPVYPATARTEQMHAIKQNAIAGTIAHISGVQVIPEAGHISSIRHAYSISSPAELASFTGRFPFLIDLLLDASTVLSQTFLDGAIYRLEVTQDMEDEDIEELVCFICTGLDPDEALEKLDAFDEAWFLDNIGETRGRLIFTLEFNDI